MSPGRLLDIDCSWVVYANLFNGCQGCSGPVRLPSKRLANGCRIPLITIHDYEA
jgi:homoserine acetyltransferase